MSPAIVVMPRVLRLWSRAVFEGSVLWRVLGRRRTVMVLREGWTARALRTARPSSPAPRTRVEIGDGEKGMVFEMEDRWEGVLG